MELNEAAVAAALDVTDRYLAAVNTLDDAAAEATFHFPHIRISNADVAIQDAPGGKPLERFRRFAAADGWHHSTWEARRPLHATEAKVHLEMEFTRRREDGSAIGRYTSIYIVTFVDGRWGIQGRSTYAP